jgi:hypothetical protein
VAVASATYRMFGRLLIVGSFGSMRDKEALRPPIWRPEESLMFSER